MAKGHKDKVAVITGAAGGAMSDQLQASVARTNAKSERIHLIFIRISKCTCPFFQKRILRRSMVANISTPSIALSIPNKLLACYLISKNIYLPGILYTTLKKLLKQIIPAT